VIQYRPGWKREIAYLPNPIPQNTPALDTPLKIYDYFIIFHSIRKRLKKPKKKWGILKKNTQKLYKISRFLHKIPH
jgi:hypothetical protein